MFHGWRFDPDGDHAAADSTRSSTSLDTGSLVKPRTARRLLTASYTSMMAYLPPAIAVWVMQSGTNATSLVFIVASFIRRPILPFFLPHSLPGTSITRRPSGTRDVVRLADHQRRAAADR